MTKSKRFVEGFQGREDDCGALHKAVYMLDQVFGSSRIESAEFGSRSVGSGILSGESSGEKLGGIHSVELILDRQLQLLQRG